MNTAAALIHNQFLFKKSAKTETNVLFSRFSVIFLKFTSEAF